MMLIMTCTLLSCVLFITVAGSLHHFTVRSSYELKLPSTLLIPFCNLKLESTLGQSIISAIIGEESLLQKRIAENVVHSSHSIVLCMDGK